MAVACPECGSYDHVSRGHSVDGSGPQANVPPNAELYDHLECRECGERFTIGPEGGEYRGWEQEE